MAHNISSSFSLTIFGGSQKYPFSKGSELKSGASCCAQVHRSVCSEQQNGSGLYLCSFCGGLWCSLYGNDYSHEQVSYHYYGGTNKPYGKKKNIREWHDIHRFPIKNNRAANWVSRYIIVWRCWTAVAEDAVLNYNKFIFLHVSACPGLFRCLYFLGLSKVRSKMKSGRTPRKSAQSRVHRIGCLIYHIIFLPFIWKQDFGITLEAWEQQLGVLNDKNTRP